MKSIIIFSFVLLIVSTTACQKRIMDIKDNPVFKEVKVDYVTSISARTEWSLNENCYVSIDYGTSTVYGARQEINTLAINGLFNLTGLNELNTYHYRLTATNSNGDMSITDDATFVTTKQQVINYISLMPRSVFLRFGESISFKAEISTSDGNSYPQHVYWNLYDDNLSSLDPNIGSINTNTGLSTVFTAGNKEGTAKLQVYGQIPGQTVLASATANINIVPNNQTGTLRGKVIYYEGDFMPPQPSGTATPVQRKVYVFEKLYLDDSDIIHSVDNLCFFTPLNKKIIAITESDAITGMFETVLPVGEYSICVLENGEYYANLFSGEAIFPVNIKNDSTTEIRFEISYKASY